MSTSGMEKQAADRRGPRGINTATGAAFELPHKVVIAGSGASQNVDLSLLASGFGNLRYTDGYVSMSVEGGASLWWYWSNNSADTIDKTATGNGTTVGAFAPSGIVIDERPQGQFLVMQTSVAANVHIWLSSGKF